MPERIHATCVLLGEAGILIRGPSGSGKSTLAGNLMDDARRAGRLARLVCDDRVAIEARHGRLVVRAVPAIAGRLELRGVGLMRVAHETAAVVRLVVDCGAEPAARLPGEAETRVELCGVSLPRLAQPLGAPSSRVAWRFSDLYDTLMAS